MRALPWLLGGGTAALALHYWTRHYRNESDTRGSDAVPTREGIASRPPSSHDTFSHVEPLTGRWVWPVAIWRGRKPEISDGFTSNRRTPAGDLVTHGGVDIMYRRMSGDPWRV